MGKYINVFIKLDVSAVSTVTSVETVGISSFYCNFCGFYVYLGRNSSPFYSE